MELHLKEKIDTINLNIIIYEDLSIIEQKRNYEMIELYPKLKKIFQILDIPEEKFKMREKRVSSKVLINHNGIFLEFKTIPPRPGNQIDHSKKNLNLQFKGEYFLENDFLKFTEIFELLEVNSVSKIEIAIDFIHKKDFLKDSMNLFLNYTDKITKLKGENKIIFNFDYENEQSIHYFNKSKCVKIYNKSLELKKNRKRPLFYNKNPEYLNQHHFRIELSISKSAIIDTNLKLKESLLQKGTESQIIKVFKNYFFKDFELTKKSELKIILQTIKQKK